MQLLYHSSTLYLLEVAATIDREAESIDPVRAEAQGTAFGQLYTETLKQSFFISECIKSAHSIISVFTSLDFRDIRALPTIFLVRVIHAVTILIKSGVSKDLDRSFIDTSPETEYARIDYQLDDMIEVMTSWGSDWPACKIIGILIMLRKWLREREDKAATTSDSSRQFTYNSAEDQGTESSPPAFTNLSTPLSYQNHAQQTSPFGFVDLAAHETTFNAPGFWDNFPDLISQFDKPTEVDSINSDLWGVQQTQQLAAIWKEDMTSDSVFPDGNEYTQLDSL